MKDENLEKMKSIIDKMSSDSSIGNVSRNENGSFEFQFDAPIPKTGLVFENTEDAEAPEPVEAEEENGSVAEIVPEIEAGEQQKEEIKPEEPEEEDDGEFIIPDVFELAEVSENSPADEYVSTIWKAYVPRFTDVTTNNYATSEHKEIKEEVIDDLAYSSESYAKSSSQITVTTRESGEDRFDVNDPTAEVDGGVPEAVVVKVNGNKAVGGDRINVFKFSEENPEEETAEDNTTEEENERREISELTGRNWDEMNKAEPVAMPSFSFEDDAPRVEFSSLKNKYTDLVAEQKEEFVVIKEREGENILPEGYEPSAKPTDASDTSEYNSFSMRESFKDKFLDLIMSVKIRLTVAILLGIATFIFDIFERRICFYFGIGLNFGAPAIIDACFIASIFLITLPETCRAVKYLMRGVVTPELSSAIVGASIFIYAIAMAVIAPIGGGYPLLASVYVVMAINSIFATYSLHSASFSAFKLISEKGNKFVMDKPLTRTLELENMALDGAVDEYKSKCARLFATPFVSGFYANAYRKTEKSKNNLIILAISFGIALVSSAVMLFTVGGPVSALSTFALVVALSMPAFTILSHKLPYSDAQREAISEESAIIGERALMDYSDVDVVTFEDTEVFGPDDVTLKSASDRRSDYLDTMRKMASLFAALGGPLCRVFENALNKKYSPAKEVAIEDDGVSGIVEGERVMAGTAAYMKRHNVRIPASQDIKVGSTRVIYAASDGEFFATFTVHYSFSEEFALLLSSMKEKGIIPLVYTRDFNINNEFMRVLTGGSDVIRVMRKYTPVKDTVVYSKINSTMVTKGEKTSAINLILSAKRYSHFQSVIAVTELSASAVGAALAVMIAFCNMIASLPTVLLSVWHIAWSVVLAISSRRTFRLRKKDNKNAE